MERLLWRLHFTSENTSNTHNRANLVQLIKENFKVPEEVELYLVQSHWLNVNMLPHKAKEVFNYLDSIDFVNRFHIINAYCMDGFTERNTDVREFNRKHNFQYKG